MRWSLRHIVIAIGSSCELDTQVEIASRLGFATPASVREIQATIDRTQKLLYGLRREKERRLLFGSAGAVVVLAALLRFIA